MAKRLFDIFFSLIGILLLSPIFLLIALWVTFDSKGGIFYRQVRVGKGNTDFKLFKFRTMHVNADKKGLLTVGANDNRITKSGLFLRKYKLDELPQLLNVFLGDMSLVGPRPEVRRYVKMYSPEQMNVLSIKPGITDYASIKYSDENELLGNHPNPEKLYIEEIMPAKLALNLQYIKDKSLLSDFKIIFDTLKKIF